MTEPTYTVFVRVPIPRGSFVDPPPVNWDTSKDKALWKILSGAAHTEIDWNQVADRFDVPVDFLLHQVAYLTERHASQVRAQVRKATAAAKGSSAPSPIPGSESAGLSHQRTASALSARRDSPMPRNEGPSSLNSSGRPIISRTTSTNTTILRDTGTASPRPRQSGPVGRLADTAGRRRLQSLPITSSAPMSPEPRKEPEPERFPSPGPAESTSESSSDDSLPAQSRIIRRPPRFQQETGNLFPSADDDTEESEPAFQPYKATGSNDLSSTLRDDVRSASRRHKKDAMRYSQTSDSSAGSAAIVQRPASKEQRNAGPGPLSPRRAAELAGRSPSGKSKGHSHSQEGSDGTPSMGSSFSDLDVTQSALEEALASQLNRTGGSRFGFSQAFRSRYSSN